jgi:cytochrome b
VEDPLKEVRETLADLLLPAALHIGGIVLASCRRHEGLTHAMAKGGMRAPGPGDIA